MEKDIYILGIESSCDDTSAAVLKNGVLLSNVTASQAVHEAYGGVVPELASRAHQQNVVPVVDQAIKRAGITKEQLTAVAFTRGPGLMGSLLVGVSFAKGFARSLGIPMIDVNHYGHMGTGMLLVPGMVFTIEPMINMGTWKVFIDADDPYGWEVISEDEMPSAQWEHTLVMTEHGVEVLTY